MKNYLSMLGLKLNQVTHKKGPHMYILRAVGHFQIK